jgi:hypothetical protein
MAFGRAFHIPPDRSKIRELDRILYFQAKFPRSWGNFHGDPHRRNQGRADSIVGRWVTDSAEEDVVAKQTECVQGWVYLLPSAKSLIALSGGFVGAFGRSRLAEKL